MSTAKINRVFEEIMALTPDEQKRLREMLDSLPANSEPKISEQEFERRLLERGIISRIPPPITDFTSYENRKPIKAKGKPVSELLLEERR